MIDALLNIPIGQNLRLGDLFSANYLAALFGNFLAALLILFLGYWLSRFVGRKLRQIGQRSPHVDVTLFNFLGSLARYAILGFTILIVLNTFGIQTTSLIAAAGAAGLAVGLALQGTLSNLAAGVMLIIFRPLKLGDFVTVGGESGTVKQITLNYTELATLANVQVIIPNARVWGNTITNYSIYDTRRAEWVFGVGYGANLATAERVIHDTIMADPRSKTDPEPFIKVTKLNDSSVDFLVRVWCDAADCFGLQADMTRAVKEALDAAGIDIPFPTRTIVKAG